MAKVVFEGNVVEIEEDELLLDSLLRQGHDVSYGCRGGSCHSCVLMADDSAVPLPFSSGSQGSLAPEEKLLNYFLACQCKLDKKALGELSSDSLNIRRVDKSSKQEQVSIIEKKWLNRSVIRLRLKSTLSFKPGQFITVSTVGKNSEKVARSYSIASHPKYHDYIELHIKYIEEGHFSRLLKNTLGRDDSLNIMGPMGKCIYSAEPNQTLLLAAIGTGLAPIYGILLDALHHKHLGDIHLVIGAKKYSDFYLIDELRALASKNDNLYLHFVALDFFTLDRESSVESVPNVFFKTANVYEYVNGLLPDMKSIKVYLCGAESFVKKLRRQSFMNGASMADIRADVFLPFVE